MAQRDDFRGLPFQISVEDIDHLLTSDADISRSSLWIPQSVRAPAEDARGGAAHARMQGESHAGGIQAALGRHGAPGFAASGSDAPIAFEMGPPGEQGQLPPAAPSYGAVHVPAPGEGSLPAKYKRIERVALTIGVVCTMVFVVSLSGQGVTGSSSASSTLAGRGQHKLTTLNAGCVTFLCPTSGVCSPSASKCPEGNPFLLLASAYRALVDCSDKTHLCNHAAGAAAKTGVSFTDDRVATALAAEGSINGKFKACDGFLCPMSGSCQIMPSNCTEGDPFANHASLYWKNALAAKTALFHAPPAASIGAKGEGAAAAESARKRGAAEATPHTIAAKGGKVAADKGGSAAVKGLFKGHSAKATEAAIVAASALPKKPSAKQLEQQEVKSEAASLEKSDAAIAASIFDHSGSVSSKADVQATVQL